MSQSKLSVVIPAYNEERTLGPLLERILKLPLLEAGWELEMIVVDDCSKDRTAEIASAYEDRVKVLKNDQNQGKGRSVRHGVEKSTGDVVLVQDADLEYEPEDYIVLLKTWRELAAVVGHDHAVVYGSRFLGQWKKWGWSRFFPGKHPGQSIGPWGANVLLSTFGFLLTGRWFTDLLTAYKIYPGAVVRGISVKTHGFETDHELTMRLLRRKCQFKEVPISYHPRSKEEGKKIRAVDFLHALRTLLRFRVVD